MFYSFFFHFLVFVFGLIHLHYILPTDLSFYVFAFLSNSAGSLFFAKIFFCHYFLLFVLLVRSQFYLKNSLLTVSFVSSKNQQKRKFSSKLSQKKNQAKLKHYYISYKVYGNLHIFSNVSVTVK